MTESAVFFSKDDVFNLMYWLLTWSVDISLKMEVLHPNWPFGVAYTVQPFLCPFFSFCFVSSK